MWQIVKSATVNLIRWSEAATKCSACNYWIMFEFVYVTLKIVFEKLNFDPKKWLFLFKFSDQLFNLFNEIRYLDTSVEQVLTKSSPSPQQISAILSGILGKFSVSSSVEYRVILMRAYTSSTVYVWICRCKYSALIEQTWNEKNCHPHIGVCTRKKLRSWELARFANKFDMLKDSLLWVLVSTWGRKVEHLPTLCSGWPVYSFIFDVKKDITLPYIFWPYNTWTNIFFFEYQYVTTDTKDGCTVNLQFVRVFMYNAMRQNILNSLGNTGEVFYILWVRFLLIVKKNGNIFILN